MTSDASFLIKKVRVLSLWLAFSGLLNVGLLSSFLFWVLKETPPTPYCEQKPAVVQDEEKGGDYLRCTEVIEEFSQLPFVDLVDRLSSKKWVESGLMERDLSLACLMGIHHFDMKRALISIGEPSEVRVFSWKNQKNLSLPICFGLTDLHFEVLIDFAKKEEFPFTSEGLFALLMKKNDSKLSATFFLVPEFWTVEHLFSRAKTPPNQPELLKLLLEGDWIKLSAFSEEQRHINDTSDTRRISFLLEYVRANSSQACLLLLKNEEISWLRKLSDDDVIAILKNMPVSLPESESFAKEMLESPRSSKVWQQAASFLYSKMGESFSANVPLGEILARFGSNKEKSSPQKTDPLLSRLPIKQKKTVSNEHNPKKLTEISSLNSQKLTKKTISIKQVSKAVSRENLYTVQEGDSLWKIACRFKVKVDDIKKLNNLESNNLKPGLILKLPSINKELVLLKKV